MCSLTAQQRSVVRFPYMVAGVVTKAACTSETPGSTDRPEPCPESQLDQTVQQRSVFTNRQADL